MVSLHQAINKKNCVISFHEAIQVANLKFIALKNFPQHLIKYFVLFSSSLERLPPWELPLETSFHSCQHPYDFSMQSMYRIFVRYF